MNRHLPELLKKSSFDLDDAVALLSLSAPEDIELLRKKAHEVLMKNCGKAVHFRGLIEFSNLCVNDCRYCGIRKSNAEVTRYFLTKDEVLSAARFCAEAGYGSLVLQSGERRDEPFIAFVEDAVASIKQATASPALPRGVGVTLCVGEQTEQTYRRFFRAGAHRYLLRIETTSPSLFAQIHPEYQTLASRLDCLGMLRRAGFQVGTGVMIGLPGQTIEDLARDALFFRDQGIDMIGMGPYIVHNRTPMSVHAAEIGSRTKEIFQLSLKMIALTRLLCRDINIAAATALQAMEHTGREQGLDFGANVIMPQVTPLKVRRDYLLYEGKPCLDENAQLCKSCLEGRIRGIGREVALNEWGDSRHFQKPS